jgi:hypothetical protein
MLPFVRPTARSAGPSGQERGDIVLSWLTKIALVMAIAGIALFDAVSVGVTAVSLNDQGGYAAREASEAWQDTASIQKAYDAALASAIESNPHNTVDTTSFTIDSDDTVHLTIRREATTLVLYRWGRTAKWAELSSDSRGRSVA